MVYTSEYPIFSVTVDIVLLTIRDDSLCALAVRRGEEPFQGRWALPGGFVNENEDLRTAAERELREETSVVTGDDVLLEQLASFGAPKRDPRSRVVSVAWLAVMPSGPTPRAGSDAVHAEWKPVDYLLARRRLAFDHSQILSEGVERARGKLEYTGLAAELVDDEFTIAELRRVYEVMWGSGLDPGNFHRKVTRTAGFVEPTGRVLEGGRGRPATLYRYAGAPELFPPLTRRSLAPR